MRCIVNGDDFGLSPGVNRGIVKALREGILTSASLLVRTPWSAEAALLARLHPELDVGLHADLGLGGGRVDADDAGACRAELERQWEWFCQLLGRPPTHLDSHHNVHRDPRLLPHFLELARRHGVPLREHSPARYLSRFYGRWGGETHPEQISPESLLALLEREPHEGVTELACHPGYVDPELRSGYAREREIELRTLCDPGVRRRIEALGIALVGFANLAEGPRREAG